MENIGITGNSSIGGLAGVLENATIRNSYTKGTINGRGFYAGGISGVMYSSEMLNSYSETSINGTAQTNLGG